MKLLSTSVFGAALFGFMAVAEAGALVPNRTIDITFVGYCDGMHLLISEATGLVTGSRTGGCVRHTPIFGTVGSNAKSGAGVTVTVTESGNSFVYVIDDLPQSWKVYFVGTELNSGTYANGATALAAGGRPSTQR